MLECRNRNSSASLLAGFVIPLVTQSPDGCSYFDSLYITPTLVATHTRKPIHLLVSFGGSCSTTCSSIPVMSNILTALFLAASSAATGSNLLYRSRKKDVC